MTQPLSKRFLLKAFACAIVIEALSLPPALLTMGHAGPEGQFATFGWLGLAVNLPGVFVAANFDTDSMFWLAVIVLAVQITTILGIMLLLRWLTSSLRSRRRHLTDHK